MVPVYTSAWMRLGRSIHSVDRRTAGCSPSPRRRENKVTKSVQGGVFSFACLLFAYRYDTCTLRVRFGLAQSTPSCVLLGCRYENVPGHGIR